MKKYDSSMDAQIAELMGKAWDIAKFIVADVYGVDLNTPAMGDRIRLAEDISLHYNHAPLGCLTLCEYYGVPLSIGTPLGGLMIGREVINLRSVNLRDQFSLEPVYFTGTPDDPQPVAAAGGHYGPLYVIRSDLNGNPLPPIPEECHPTNNVTSVGFTANFDLSYEEYKGLIRRLAPKEFLSRVEMEKERQANS